MIDSTQNVYIKNMWVIIFAKGISDFGVFLNMVALSTYVYFVTNNSIFVGIFLASRVFGGICASLIGVKFFNNFFGKKPLMVFNLSRAFLLSLIIVIPNGVLIYSLPFIAFSIGFANSMFSIGLNTQLPNLVSGKYLILTNSWMSSISATATILGSMTAGFVIALWSYHIVFLINAITYLIAAFCLLPLKFDISSQIKIINLAYKRVNSTFRIFTKNKILASMLFISLADTFASAAHNVGFPILSKLISPVSSGKVMGLIIAFWAIGKLCGAKIIGLILKHNQLKKMETAFFSGVVIMSFGFIILFQQHVFIFLILFAIVAGIGDGVSEVSLLTRIQFEEEQVRLAIFSFLTFLQMTGFGIGMLIVSPVFQILQPAQVIFIFHLIPILSIITLIIWFKKQPMILTENM